MRLWRSKRKKTSTRSRLRDRRRKRIAIFTSIGVLLFASLVVGAAHIPVLQVQTVTVSGTDAVDADELQNAAQRELSGAYAFVFPRANTLIYPQEKITQTLAEAFPRLKDIAVRRAALAAIEVSVSEHSPHGIWCGEERAEGSAQETCYFLGKNGELYARAPSFSDDVYLRFYGTLAEGEAEAGKGVYLSGPVFQKMHTLVSRIGERGFEVVAVTQPNDVDAHIHFADGSFVKVNKQRSVTETMKSIQATLNADAFIAEREAGNTLQYIDVRFEDRVFYKFE